MHLPRTKLLLALILTMPLLSCTTAPTVAPQVSSPSPATVPEKALQAIPCASLHQIPYHAPKDPVTLQAWLKNKLQNTGGIFDTPSTVTEIRKFNAEYQAVCAV